MADRIRVQEVFMTRKDIIKKLYLGRELEKLAEKALRKVEEHRTERKFRMAAVYSYDLALIYDLLEDAETAERYYRAALEHLRHAGSQPPRVKLGSLCALGKFREALQAAQNDPRIGLPTLAFLHEKVGEHGTAQRLYTKSALERLSKVQGVEGYLRPHALQDVSDLWMRSQNMEKACKYNQLALEAWEKMRDTIQIVPFPIGEAWLHEEVGYIYEKASEYEAAREYYQKAKARYRLSYTEKYQESTEINHVYSAWDFHYKNYFYLQLFPDFDLLNLLVDSYKNHDFRRIEYRILNLEEQMKA